MSFFPSLASIGKQYNVPACRGRIVFTPCGQGVITGWQYNLVQDPYIEVVLDADKPYKYRLFHPIALTYGNLGEIRKISEKQFRYAEWLKSKDELTFIDWLKINHGKKIDNGEM